MQDNIGWAGFHTGFFAGGLKPPMLGGTLTRFLDIFTDQSRIFTPTNTFFWGGGSIWGRIFQDSPPWNPGMAYKAQIGWKDEQAALLCWMACQDLLEVGLGLFEVTCRLIGYGPHDHRGPVLVPGHKLRHHVKVVLQSLGNKVVATVKPQETKVMDWNHIFNWNP